MERMIMVLFKNFILAFILLLFISCATEPQLKIISQKNGPWITNCYLVYDAVSREAAIIDAGFPVDTLLAHISDHNLKLKYIFVTHCHQDHIAGVPGIMKQFPEAKLCFTQTEYESLTLYSQWREIYSEPFVKAWEADSATAGLMDFDYNQLGKPDVFVEEEQEFKLGGMNVSTLFIPGHSRGTACYIINDNLFTGDLIMYHSVGYLDYKLGSKEEIITSIRKLYSRFPDSAVIYPGHGAVSSIGLEKSSNRVVTPDSVKWQ